MKVIFSAIAISGVCLALGASPVSAQGGVMRPYRGLFGGAAPEPGQTTSLDGTVTAGAGYDNNDAPPAYVLPLQQTGGYGIYDADLAYTHNGKDVQFTASGFTSGRYYQDGGLLGATQSGSFALSAPMGRRVRVHFDETVSYTPSYVGGLFPSVLTPLEPVSDAGSPLTDQHATISNTGAQMDIGLGRHTTVELLGTYEYGSLEETGGASVLRSYSGGGRLRHGLSRYASLRVGYVYQQGNYGGSFSRPITIHNIDIGVDYSRPLSLSRHTQLTIGTGSSLVSAPVTQTLGGTASQSANDTQLQYRFTADVGLTHQFARTWQARAAYNRGMEFIPGLSQPVFTDAVRMSTSGFLSRRVDLMADTGVSIGQSGVATTGSDQLHAYTATVRLRWALARSWAAYAEYNFYDQDLGQALDSQSTIPSIVQRNSVSAGLTMWLPILRK